MRLRSLREPQRRQLPPTRQRPRRPPHPRRHPLTGPVARTPGVLGPCGACVYPATAATKGRQGGSLFNRREWSTFQPALTPPLACAETVRLDLS
jgi:hypothetical protein